MYVSRNIVSRSRRIYTSSAIKKPDRILLEDNAFMAIYYRRQQ
jgi:hypothetical protein